MEFGDEVLHHSLKFLLVDFSELLFDFVPSCVNEIKSCLLTIDCSLDPLFRKLSD